MQLAQKLASQGLLSEADLRRLGEFRVAEPDKPIHEIIIEKGLAKEDAVLKILGEEFGMEVVDLSNATIPPETLALMPTKFVHRKYLLPVSQSSGTLVVATSDPYDVYSLDELQTLTGLKFNRSWQVREKFSA